MAREIEVFIDRRYIKYEPPFSIEKFGLFHDPKVHPEFNGVHRAIGVDRSGYSCVRFKLLPHLVVFPDILVELALDELNKQPVSDFMESNFVIPEDFPKILNF